MHLLLTKFPLSSIQQKKNMFIVWRLNVFFLNTLDDMSHVPQLAMEQSSPLA